MKKVVINSIFLFSDKIIKLIVGLFVGVWIARYFGPEIFGKFNYANSLVILFASILPLGTEGLIVRDLVKEEKKNSDLLSSSLLLHLISGIILFFLAIFFFYILKYSDNMTFYFGVILAAPMLFRFLSVPRYYYEARIEIKYIVTIENISFLFFSLCRILLLFYEFSILYFIISFFLEAFFSYLSIFLFYFYQRKILDFKFVPLVSGFQSLKESFPILVSTLSIVIYMKVDQLMIGSMLGDSSIGVYSVGVKLSEFWYFIPMGLASSVFPTLVSKRKTSRSEYLEFLKALHIILIFTSILMAVFVQWIGKDLVIFLYGNPYALASDVLKIYIWSGIFVFIGVAGGNYFLIENKQGYVLWKSLSGLLVNVVLNFFWIQMYGIYGAAFATLVSQFVASCLIPFFFKDVRELSFIQISSLLFWKWPKVLSSVYQDLKIGS